MEIEKCMCVLIKFFQVNEFLFIEYSIKLLCGLVKKMKECNVDGFMIFFKLIED